VSEREDAVLERVLLQVDHPGLEDPGLDLRGDERRLWREYGELSGLLPYALDPMPPPRDLLAGVLASVRSEGAALDAAGAPRSAALAAAPIRRRSSAGPRVLAAAAVALLMGVGLAAGWLAGERARLRQNVAGLELRLQESALREQELHDAEAELSRLRGVFTAAGMRVCPLRPYGQHPAQPVARAVVYFDGGRHQWFLAARDLEPCRQGSHYVLWFMVDGKPVEGGSFRAEKGVPVALAAEETPGSMNGAFLTLEPDAGGVAPTGPPILYGEDPEEML
jgi:anti-sigma-K factor RskA